MKTIRVLFLFILIEIPSLFGMHHEYCFIEKEPVLQLIAPWKEPDFIRGYPKTYDAYMLFWNDLQNVYETGSAKLKCPPLNDRVTLCTPLHAINYYTYNIMKLLQCSPQTGLPFMKLCRRAFFEPETISCADLVNYNERHELYNILAITETFPPLLALLCKKNLKSQEVRDLCWIHSLGGRISFYKMGLTLPDPSELICSLVDETDDIIVSPQTVHMLAVTFDELCDGDILSYPHLAYNKKAEESKIKKLALYLPVQHEFAQKCVDLYAQSSYRMVMQSLYGELNRSLSNPYKSQKLGAAVKWLAQKEKIFTQSQWRELHMAFIVASQTFSIKKKHSPLCVPSFFLEESVVESCFSRNTT